MSRPKLEDYKQEYSRLVSKMAELHNRNRDFVLTPTSMARTDIRKMINELREISRMLRYKIIGVVNEEKQIRKENAERRKIERAEEALKPKVLGRPRKYPPRPPKGTRPLGRPRKYPKPESPTEEGGQG